MKIRISHILVLLAATVATYAGWAAVRAHRDVVTLNVRNMDIRDVVRKIEWQTWDTIVVHSNVQGKVTLNVAQRPVGEVLEILGEQTSSRSSVVYPLYSSRKSFSSFKQVLSGEQSATLGWTNLQASASARPGFGMMRGEGFAGGSGASSNQLVSLQIGGKAISTATQAFSRFARARVVPEDGVAERVYLTFKNVSTSEAVSRLAKSVHRSWAKVYALRKESGPGGPDRGNPIQMAARDSKSETRPAPGVRRGGGPPESEEARAQREAQENELLEMLPADERQKAEQAQAEREQQRQEREKLTPEQRREAGPQMGGPNMNNRMLDRIKNTTPEQRVEQRRQMAQLRPPGSQGQFARR